MSKKIEGKIVDIFNKRVYLGVIHIIDGVIHAIEEKDDVDDTHFVMPGFVDSHVHIESSMLVPSRFAEMAVTHGTVATVSDPHEIANVLGVEGVDYMINDGKRVPLKFHFGAPSCVPATPFETSGAVIDSKQVNELLQKNDVYFLAEMMNFPGVINGDNEVYNKLSAAHKNGKPVDGHAPGVLGENLKTYARAGISTDHETAGQDEAVEKLESGIKLQIREGSAAKSFDDLIELMDYYPDSVMFCTDDCHPDDLRQSHINGLVRRAWERGSDFYDVLKAATVNPVNHYNLPVGMLREGDPADFILVDNLDQFNIRQTYINGELVYDKGNVMFGVSKSEAINHFSCDKIAESDIRVPAENKSIRVIEAHDRSLLTGEMHVNAPVKDGCVVSDIDNDILKIVVLNRYQKAKPVIGFVHGFGLKHGAIAGSIAHDSHNIIAVGANDQDIVKGINKLIDNEGGIVAVYKDTFKDLKLDVAGLMSREDGAYVAFQYEQVNQKAKKLGTTLEAPFMTLAFMSLLVIPKLKIGDQGLFDVDVFKSTNLFV